MSLAKRSVQQSDRIPYLQPKPLAPRLIKPYIHIDQKNLSLGYIISENYWNQLTLEKLHMKM